MKVIKKFNYLLEKKWLKIVLSLLFSFLVLSSLMKVYPIKRFEKDANLEQFTDHLNERFPTIMKDYDIPGVSIALINDGSVVWKNAYGYADLETYREMKVDTYCRVQSISKPITSWGVMKLVEEGKVGLDVPIKSYIKSWPFFDSKYSLDELTLRQLLSHTSGLPLGDVMRIYSPNEEIPSLRENLSKEGIPFQSSGAFYYSNVGFNVLEMLIEDVTGLDYAEYMEKEVLTPLGMNNSSFNWNKEMNVPTGYNLSGHEIPVYVYPEKASGGLFATAEDIANFSIAGMPDYVAKEMVLDKQSIRSMYQSNVNITGLYNFVFDSYGLGYFIENLSDGKKAVAHGGQGTGIMSHLHIIPETGDGIVILTNSQRSWPLIAYILRDWTEWTKLPSLGMSQIILGQLILWGLIGFIVFIVFWQLLLLVQGIIQKKRMFAPFSRKSRLLRLGQSIIFFILSAVIFWCISQPYLDISSVFPIASVWLGISIMSFAIILLLFALFPRR